jgi:uncharacterized DUF497 family protein
MDEHFELSGQVFEWDKYKALLNVIEHNIKFTYAATAFMDSGAIEFPDDEHSDEELRATCIGIALDGRLLRVSFTERMLNIRIFSARFGDRYDKSRYANGY